MTIYIYDNNRHLHIIYTRYSGNNLGAGGRGINRTWNITGIWRQRHLKVLQVRIKRTKQTNTHIVIKIATLPPLPLSSKASKLLKFHILYINHSQINEIKSNVIILKTKLEILKMGKHKLRKIENKKTGTNSDDLKKFLKPILSIAK